MTTNIQASGIDLTEALRTYAIEKMEGVQKYFENIQHIEIDIGMRTHHHNKGKVYYAEVTIAVPKQTVRVTKESENLYKAIDKVKDHLKVEFEKIKGKMRQKNKGEIRQQKQYTI